MHGAPPSKKWDPACPRLYGPMACGAAGSPFFGRPMLMPIALSTCDGTLICRSAPWLGAYNPASHASQRAFTPPIACAPDPPSRSDKASEKVGRELESNSIIFCLPYES
jgi:hypothetical protein